MFNIFSVPFCLTCSVRCHFHNTMTRRKPVGVIRQPSTSGRGDKDGLEFIRCVGGREPHVNVERLGVPAPYCGTGGAWTENILVPNLCWGDGRGYESWASATRSRPRFDSLDSWDDEQWI